ncbi:hypothetical protein Zmor_016174 [Zophobas morio]|uniref:N-acetyltransferase domain-containing protein n=1 Tax=Zophobas morio TaxID=2755281 RepID=A0AA38IQ11_9CUCU|nr:hypothetical protein Zmor_016174 [Zophobas morio]
MGDKIWTINDNVHCQLLTSAYLEEALRFIETAFYPHENICKTMEITKDPEALVELRELTTSAAKDGVTLIAVDKRSNKIVGVAFNKIQVRDDPVFENLAKRWKRPLSKAIVEFMAYIDNLYNLFEHCQIECLFELMFLATLTDYRGQGIGRKLTEVSVEIARDLANGINVKKSVDGSQLALEPAPKIISSIFTSIATQKIGRQLGFQVVVELDYEGLDFQGMSFTKVAESGTKKLTLEYKKLT